MPVPGQTNVVEAVIRYRLDAGQASAGTKALQRDVQQLDRAAQEAQKSLSRMSQAERAAQGQGGVYGVQWNYGTMGATQGQSKAQAYYGQNFRPTPPPLPGNRYSPAMPGGGGGGGGGFGGAGAHEMMQFV